MGRRGEEPVVVYGARSSRCKPDRAPDTAAPVPRRLPALALLLGALSLYGAAPAQAQTIWVAEFTVANQGSGDFGCTPASQCASRLTDKDFTVGGTDYVVELLYDDVPSGQFAVAFNSAVNTALQGLKFCVGPTAFAFSSASLTNSDHRANWTGANLAWSAGQKVPLSIGTACAPGAPTSLGATPSAGQLDLSWTAPTATGGSAITGYDVHYTGSATVGDGAPAFPFGSDPATGWVNAAHNGTTASDSLTGLMPVTAYRVRVRAVNAAGSSPWVRVSGTTPAVPPAEVAGLEVAPSSGQLALSWSAPPTTGGSAITGYDVHYTSSTTVDDDAASDPRGSRDGWFDTNHGTATTRTITGLTNDVAYRVRVRAVNAAGAGPWVHRTGTPELRNPTFDSVSLSVGGSPVTLTRLGEHGWKATVPRDATSVTVTPTWTGSSTATVSSREVFSKKEITAPQNVTSGGSVSVNLATGLAYNAAGDEHRTQVEVLLTRAEGYSATWGVIVYKGGPISASLSVSPNPVLEGDENWVETEATVTLSWPWDGEADAVIPLTGTNGSAEDGDWILNKPNVTIRRGESTGTARISVWPDDDTDDETMTVALGTLPRGARQDAADTELTAGTPSSVELTITDDEGAGGGDPVQDDRPTVTLSATPNPVPEGSALEVTATLSAALASEVTIPVLATRYTAEHDDIATHRLRLMIPAGATSATGTLATTIDVDGDDERFLVAVVTEELPLNVVRSHSSVEVTIEDTTTTPPETAPTVPVVTVTAGNRVTEGTAAEFTLTAAPAPASDLGVIVTVSESGAFAERNAIGSSTATIPAGATSATFTVTTVDDTVDEADGSVTATLASGTGYTVGAAASATVTVADNDAADTTPGVPVVTVTAGSGVTEGTAASFTLSAAPAPASDLSVAVTVTESGTFAQPSALGARTVTIPAGSTSAALTVATVDDTTDEPNGSVTATLGSGTGYTLGAAASAQVAVADNDAPAVPVVTVTAGSGVTEGTAAGFTLSAAPAPASDLSVAVTVTESGTFAQPSALGARTVTIPAGSTSAALTVATVDDTTDEPNGSVTATLGSGTGYTVGAAASAEVAVADNDAPAPVWSATLTAKVLQFQFDSGIGCDTQTTGAECSSSSILTDDDFSLGGQDYTVEQINDGDFDTLTLILSSQSAPGDDLKALSFCVGTRAFALSGISHLLGNEYHKNWSTDVGWSASDTVKLSIGSACPSGSGGGLGGTQGQSAATVSLSAEPSTVAEGSGVTVTATLSSALSSDVTIPLALTDGTAEAGDHGALAGITINAGSTRGSGTVTTNQDDDADDETFTVSLASSLPSSVAAGTPSSVEVTITDDDGGTQGQGGPGPASGPYADLIAKMYEWRNDPQWAHAKAHTDRWDRALLAFGETVEDSSLTPMTAAEAQGYADRGWERWVEVAAAMWEMEGGRPAPDPVVTVAAGGGVTEGAAARFTLTADPAPAADLAVTVAVSQSGDVADASALGERTVTIPAGSTSADFTVATVDDEADEENGRVVAALAAGGGYTVGDAARATVTVADDDEDNPAILTDRAIAREGDDEAVVFNVRLDGPASHTVTVDYATADGAGVWASTGTATAGVDYTATSGTLSFAAGETWQSVSVPILDDVIDEGTEYFLLRFSNPQGATLEAGRREVQGLIRNTDLIPGALLARFGRAAAEQVVTQIEERMAAPRRRGFRARFAGREFRSGQERDFALGFLTQFAQPMGMGPAGAASMGMGPAGGAPMGMGPHAGGAGAFGVSTGGMNGMGAAGGAMGMGGMGAAGGSMGMTGMGAAGGSMGMGGMPGAMGGYGPAGGAHGGGLLGSMGMGGDLFSNSEFELNRESRGGMLSVWSRTSRSYFSGLEDALSLDGDVRTTMFGADYARGALTLGLSVGRTLGLGGYRRDAAAGQMTTSMTGFYPWVGYQVNERVSVWGVTGYGTGGLSLTPEGHAAMETGVSMAMSAVGTRGELIGARATGGFALAFKADALYVTAASDLVDGKMGRLNASDAGVTRVRTALEGSRGYTLVGGRLSLTPSVEVGLRRDGGDAETGAGMDVGGGLAFTDAVTGLSLDVRVRTLVVHQAEGFSERGMSLSFGWDPTPSSPLGLTARVAPSWGGQAMGGAEALWNNQMAYGMGSHQMYGAGGQLNADVGYGLPVGARLVGTPRVGLTTSQYGRDYRVGYGLGVLDRGKLTFELGVDAQRREMAAQGQASNGVMGRGTVGW